MNNQEEERYYTSDNLQDTYDTTLQWICTKFSSPLLNEEILTDFPRETALKIKYQSNREQGFVRVSWVIDWFNNNDKECPKEYLDLQRWYIKEEERRDKRPFDWFGVLSTVGSIITGGWMVLTLLNL